MLNLAGKIFSDESNEEQLILESDKPHALAWREWSQDAVVFSESGSFEIHGVLDLLEELNVPRVETSYGHFFM